MSVKILDNFFPLTSDIDWCESNYVVSSWIAEFYNTISNLPFFILPPLLAYLNRHYSARVTKLANIVWAIMLFIGVGSAYFHATLSFVGQILDEVAINWMIVVCLVLWFPEKQLRPSLRKRRVINCTLLGAGTIATVLAFWKPALNALFLVSLGVPVAYMVSVEVKRFRKCDRLTFLGIQMILYWVLALTCWFSDKFLCHHWQAIHFPYLHCLWHIFIAMSGSITVVICMFYDSMHMISEQKPIIKFWPKDNWVYFGIPYVGFKAGPVV